MAAADVGRGIQFGGRVDADDFSPIDSNYGHAQSPPVGGAIVEAFAPAAGEVRSPAVVLGQENASAYRRLIEDGPGAIV